MQLLHIPPKSIAHHNTPDELSGVIAAIQVGYITVSIRQVITDSFYEIYVTSKQRGSTCVDNAFSYEEAQQRAEAEAEELRTRLEIARKKPPTAKQLVTLFQMKIPIPLTLTSGQASDLIDERLTQLREQRLASMHLAPDKA